MSPRKRPCLSCVLAMAVSLSPGCLTCAVAVATAILPARAAAQEASDFAADAAGEELPAEPEAEPPAPAPAPAGQPSVNLLFEEVRPELERRLEQARSQRDTGKFSEARQQAQAVADEWAAKATEWRSRALEAIQKEAAGQATDDEVQRSLQLYRLGEEALQDAQVVLWDVLDLSGQRESRDLLAFARLEELKLRSRTPSLAEPLGPLVRRVENLLLAQAASHVTRKDARAATASLTRLQTEVGTVTMRRTIGEKLLALYTDLITERRLHEAARIALWYARNGDLRSHSWRRETMRLAEVALGPDPVSETGTGRERLGIAGSLGLARLLTQFFVDGGTADPHIWGLIGHAYQHEADYLRAIYWYEQVARERPHDAEVHVRIAQSQAALGLIEESVCSVVEAIDRGYPPRWILDDPELAAIRATPCYLSLKDGALF